MLRDYKYSALSMVVDEAGAIHAAAMVSPGIVYLTNASGEWVQTGLSLPTEADEVDAFPAIAIDESGMLVVAFRRGACFEMGCGGFQIFLVTHDPGGEWSQPVPIAEGDSPSIQLRDGVVHLAYLATLGYGDVACEEPAPVRYLTNAGGSWREVPVARHGDIALLQIGSDGLPRVMVGSYPCHFLGQEGLYYATASSPTGRFGLEPVPGTRSADDRLVDFVLDESDKPHAVFWRFADTEDENHYLFQSADSWASTMLSVPSANVVSMAIGPEAAVDLIAHGGSGTWYVSNAEGTFQSELVSDAFGVWSQSAGIVVDPSGRTQMLFAVGDYEHTEPGLFHALGPVPND